MCIVMFSSAILVAAANTDNVSHAAMILRDRRLGASHAGCTESVGIVPMLCTTLYCALR